MKRTVKFLDKNRNLVVAECCITTRNGYPEFTMSGQYKGSSGQCFGDVKTDTDKQKELINIWHEWHLNGMNAGTPEQEKALKGCQSSDYETRCNFLKEKGLFEVKHPETGEIFKYGYGWYIKPLPEGFEDKLNNLLDEIEEQNNDERKVTEDDYELFTQQDFESPETAHAIAVMLELSINEIDDISEEGNYRYCVQGVDYIAGTDEEMDEVWDEYLDNYIEDCILPELPKNMVNYFDTEKWKDDARIDGRAHTINNYDGSELSCCIDDVWYYAYRN